MLNFCDFIQVYVFTTNHHLNSAVYLEAYLVEKERVPCRMTNVCHY